MEKIRFFIFCILAYGVFACVDDNGDAEYFNGEIRQFNDSHKIMRNITSTTFAMIGRNYGEMAVYDSLIIYWNPKLQDHSYNVFSADTGKEIGSFCHIGRGPKESTSLNPIFQLYKKNNDVMSLLKATNENQLFFWNISQSIKKGTTVYDTIVPYINKNRDRSASYFRMFRQSDSTVLVSVSSIYLSNYKMTMPSYMQRTIYTDELLDEYTIYRNPEFENKKSGFVQFDYFYTYDALKPDGSKIVQAMHYLPQINIIDTETGEIIGYRPQKTPGFSLFETNMKPLNCYYTSVQADDKCIYATYWGKKEWNASEEVNEIPDLRTIHVYDWEGNFLYEITTDRTFFRVSLDPVRNRLYTTDLLTSEVSYLNLNELEPFR